MMHLIVGALRDIATTDAHHSAVLPNVLTVVERLNATMRETLADPDIVRVL